MSRVGEGPQPGYESPAINRPNSFKTFGPINTTGSVVFNIIAGDNVTITDGKPGDNARVIYDNGNLIKYGPWLDSASSGNGLPISGQRILGFGATSVNTAFGRLAFQQGDVNNQWSNMTQSDKNRQDNPSGFKYQEGAIGDAISKFVNEGCVQMNSQANIGQAFITGTGGTTTQWQTIAGNIFQVGYGLGDGGGLAGKRMMADFAQETKYPLDFLKNDQRVFAFSTRRLSHEQILCMEVYREGDVTDTAQIGWDSNGKISVSQLAAHSSKGGTPANVRVKTWYNQSGNGYDASVVDLASNPLRGPLIYLSTGSVAKTFGGNAIPALAFSGVASNQEFLVANTGGSADVPQPLWASVSYALDNYTSGERQYIFDGDSNNRTALIKQPNATGLNTWFAGAQPTISGLTNNNDNQVTVTFNGTDSLAAVNGTVVSSAENVGTFGNDGLTIGSRFSVSQFLEGAMAEIVMFKSSGTSLNITDAWVSRYLSNNNLYFDLY